MVAPGKSGHVDEVDVYHAEGISYENLPDRPEVSFAEWERSSGSLIKVSERRFDPQVMKTPSDYQRFAEGLDAPVSVFRINKSSDILIVMKLSDGSFHFNCLDEFDIHYPGRSSSVGGTPSSAAEYEGKGEPMPYQGAEFRYQYGPTSFITGKPARFTVALFEEGQKFKVWEVGRRRLNPMLIYSASSSGNEEAA